MSLPKAPHQIPREKAGTAPRLFWKHLLRSLPTIFVIAAATFALDRLGFLDHFETAGLDTFNLLQSGKEATDVVLLGINDEDYEDKQLFSGTSPLRCETVQKIIEAIATGRPRVIGVDLDTSSPQFACLQIPDDWPPIVWAEDGIWDEKAKGFVEVRCLAGNGPARNRDEYGLARTPLDRSDGIARRYRRELPLKNGGHIPSLPWAVLQAAAGAGCQKCQSAIDHAPHEPERGLVLNFAGRRFADPLSVRYLLQIADTPGWRENGPLKDKIVLLGGYYWQARDSLVTPIGSVPSLNIVSQAIETELRGGGIRPFNEAVAVVLDILGGILIVFINYRFHDRLGVALLFSLLAIPFVSLIGSFLAFSTLALWFNFVPVAISALIHEFYDHAREYQRLRESH
jgi:hypothetical protein